MADQVECEVCKSIIGSVKIVCRAGHVQHERCVFGIDDFMSHLACDPRADFSTMSCGVYECHNAMQESNFSEHTSVDAISKARTTTGRKGAFAFYEELLGRSNTRQKEAKERQRETTAKKRQDEQKQLFIIVRRPCKISKHKPQSIPLPAKAPSPLTAKGPAAAEKVKNLMAKAVHAVPNHGSSANIRQEWFATMDEIYYIIPLKLDIMIDEGVDNIYMGLVEDLTHYLNSEKGVAPMTKFALTTLIGSLVSAAQLCD